MSATIYATITDPDGDVLVVVDCDTCYAAICDPTIAVGSDWVLEAVTAHDAECRGKP